MKECCETGAPKRRYWHWVVLGIVVVLAGVLQLVPIRVHTLDEVRRVEARAALTVLLQSLDEYEIDNNKTYPTSLQQLVTPDAHGNANLRAFNGQLPRDPWNREYVYTPPTPNHPRPRVFTLGADGQPGGSGEDADVDSDHLDEGR